MIYFIFTNKKYSDKKYKQMNHIRKKSEYLVSNILILFK
ncbi:Uncharacterized protein dnm_061440 [Desulfonema magnum]|uniref:Uncharacterized protein n=1 Tax=Desulfonema magnum TaxID=45655 RepID=A0A975BR49_9BACT|nr:Uncharacterized protein dnm_061440 [Desulfonema magnum]